MMSTYIQSSNLGGRHGSYSRIISETWYVTKTARSFSCYCLIKRVDICTDVQAIKRSCQEISLEQTLQDKTERGTEIKLEMHSTLHLNTGMEGS
jgi:hypothetical protein